MSSFKSASIRAQPQLDSLAHDLDAVAKRSRCAKSFFDSTMPDICAATNSRGAIVWKLHDGAQLRWFASHALDGHSAGVDSEFTKDVLLNVEEAFRQGKCDAYPPVDERNLLADQLFPKSDQSPVDEIRTWVVNHQQLLIPIHEANSVEFVLLLFQTPAETPASELIEDLDGLQTVLERAVPKIGMSLASEVAAPLPDESSDVETVNSAAPTAVAHVPDDEDARAEPVVLSKPVAKEEPAVAPKAKLPPVSVSIGNSERQELLAAARLGNVVNRHLETQPVAYDVVNELYSFLGVSRICLASSPAKSCKILAVSNLQLFDSRSVEIGAVQKLALQVAKTGEPLILPCETNMLAGVLEKAVDTYFETTNSRSVAVLPIFEPAQYRDDPDSMPSILNSAQASRGRVVNVVLVEDYRLPIEPLELNQKWDLVEPAITNALVNSNRYSGVFLMPLWSRLGRLARVFQGAKRKTLLFACAALVAIAFLLFYPADLRLRAGGVIQPVNRARVFAQVSGVVEQLNVEDGQWVEQDELLLTLANPQLSAEIARVSGEMREAQERLRTGRLQRMMAEELDAQQRDELVQLCAALQASEENLQNQLALLNRKSQQLEVRSPMAGQVVTWDTQRRLKDRPVESGQRLLTVADPKGPWELELLMPDDRSGYLPREISDTDGPLTTYVLASEPTRTHNGKLRASATATDVDQEVGNVVRLFVDVDSAIVDSSVRPGTEVIAHVHVGKRSIGFTKLYSFFDWVNRQLFKYL